MGIEKVDQIWLDGEFVPWNEAKIHVLSHALHYGTSWFEGVRCYKTERGSEVFRLQDHTRRLFNSCKIYRTEIPFSQQEINQAILKRSVRMSSKPATFVHLSFAVSEALG